MSCLKQKDPVLTDQVIMNVFLLDRFSCKTLVISTYVDLIEREREREKAQADIFHFGLSLSDRLYKTRQNDNYTLLFKRVETMSMVIGESGQTREKKKQKKRKGVDDEDSLCAQPYIHTHTRLMNSEHAFFSSLIRLSHTDSSQARRNTREKKRVSNSFLQTISFD